jgi:hypothetical protein
MRFVDCPDCGQIMTNDGDRALQMVDCPSCFHTFQMPLLDSPGGAKSAPRKYRRRSSGGSTFGGLVVGLISGIVIGLAISDRVELVDFAKLVPDLGGYRVGLAVKKAMPWMMWVAAAHLVFFVLTQIMHAMASGGQRNRRQLRA